LTKNSRWAGGFSLLGFFQKVAGSFVISLLAPRIEDTEIAERELAPAATLNPKDSIY